MSEPSGTCRMIAAFSDVPVDSYWLPSGEFDYAAEEEETAVWRAEERLRQSGYEGKEAT
jgi:hypothetical protein